MTSERFGTEKKGVTCQRRWWRRREKKERIKNSFQRREIEISNSEKFVSRFFFLSHPGWKERKKVMSGPKAAFMQMDIIQKGERYTSLEMGESFRRPKRLLFHFGEISFISFPSFVYIFFLQRRTEVDGVAFQNLAWEKRGFYMSLLSLLTG